MIKHRKTLQLKFKEEKLTVIFKNEIHLELAVEKAPVGEDCIYSILFINIFEFHI